MALIKSTAIPSGATDYELEQSLRFDQNRSTSLSKTPTSAGNRTTWTYSVWMKLGQFGDGWNMIFNAGQSDGGGSAGTRLTGLLMYNSTLYIYWDSAAGGTNPAMKLRDNSAWYHVCLVATSSSLACYINGTLVGTKSGSGNGAINNTQAHAIGSRADVANSYFNGLMSEAHFIDGQAKAPADFGETGDYGEWKPIEYSGSYGTNGFYLSFEGGGTMSATGGTITTDGDYKVHSFTSNGTFTPSSITDDGYVEYLVIGGGGAGAADGATTPGNGGGGAGGYRTGMLPVTAQAYSITVGAGGIGTTGSNQVNGGNSVFSSITSAGGGGGGYYTSTPGAAGGSGGGGAAPTAVGGAASPAGQGNAGEQATNGQGGGGGGGAGEAGGTDGTGQGGDGLASSITGSSVTRAGGGGGSRASGGARAGGTGGGGAGGNGGAGTSGTANTGSGGGAGVSGGSAGSGGSGIVIIRYKFQ